jgi:regulator of sigma E protease
MFTLLISIVGILLTIFFVVGTHEAAHFAMARFVNVKVLRFSIGFGTPFYTWRDKSGTEYTLAPIPLGGYVKMLDESEGVVPQAEKHLAFNRQPYYKKFLIVLAGPAINLISAFLLYWLIFMIGFTTIKPVIGSVDPHSIAANGGLLAGQEITQIDKQETLSWTGILLRFIAHLGDKDSVSVTTINDKNQTSTHDLNLAEWEINELKPDPLSSLGITPFQPPMPMIVGNIAENSPAAKSGIKMGDELIAINKKPIKEWEQLIKSIMLMPDQTAAFTIKRDNKVITIPVTIGYKRGWLFNKTGYLGIGPYVEWPKEMLRTIQYSPLGAISRAWEEMVDFTYFNFLLIGKLLIGKMSLHSLGGPITIFESAGQALNSGFLAFLGFLAFISISIGIINVLPIPGLDGGHLLVQTIEAVIRRPLPDIVIVNLYRAGFLLLLVVMIQAFVNDVLRLY